MCPSFWRITPPSDHIKVDVQGTFVMYLDVELPGFSVGNISSGQEMQFDTSFKINPLKAPKIKGMLTTVFFVYLIIEHQSFYRSLDLSNLSDNGQDSKEAILSNICVYICIVLFQHFKWPSEHYLNSFAIIIDICMYVNKQKKNHFHIICISYSRL